MRESDETAIEIRSTSQSKPRSDVVRIDGTAIVSPLPQPKPSRRAMWLVPSVSVVCVLILAVAALANRDGDSDQGAPEAALPAEAPAPHPTGDEAGDTESVDRAGARQLYLDGVRESAAGSLDVAELAFESALDLDPELAAAHRGLGLMYEKRGDNLKARAAYVEYLRKAPDADDADVIRARLAALGNR